MDVNYKHPIDNAISMRIFYTVIGDVEMIADRIKMLREENGISQAGLAQKLGIKRASVNAWEMGINFPTAENLIKLATFFQVSADCLLCLSQNASVDISGLTDDDVKAIYSLIHHLKNKNVSN